jgi:hypothetical protein
LRQDRQETLFDLASSAGDGRWPQTAVCRRTGYPGLRASSTPRSPAASRCSTSTNPTF